MLFTIQVRIIRFFSNSIITFSVFNIFATLIDITNTECPKIEEMRIFLWPTYALT